MAFKWIRKAQENGAKIIHVDPRFTRTSATADIYARIRPGTDAALQNTMINYVLVNKLYDEDYVVTHTNALMLVHPQFDFKDGVFSGYDAEAHKYDTTTWGYQLDGKGKPKLAEEPGRPALRLRAPQGVRLALHARDGRDDHGHPGRADQDDRRHDGEEPAGLDPLRARDDAAHDGRAGHPLVHDPAAPPRQHRQARRRRERAARRAERAGRVRHGRPRELHAGLPEPPDDERADGLRLRAQLRARGHEVPHQQAQGLLRRRGDAARTSTATRGSRSGARRWTTARSRSSRRRSRAP